jgi:hypothetical protein
MRCSEERMVVELFRLFGGIRDGGSETVVFMEYL